MQRRVAFVLSGMKEVIMSLVTLGWTGLVGLTGACGALVRYLVGLFFAERTGSTFPWGTLLINVTGAFLIGLIAGLTTKKLLSPLLQTLLATGFLGGYTTFSAMSLESVQLINMGESRLSLLYLVGTILPGLLAAALGLALGGWL
jgi:fluoride exporter